jgi:hypothetical protein
VVAQTGTGKNNFSSIIDYFSTDYMLETIFFVYYLLFIYTFYLYKLDVSRKIFLLNSQNNDTTILGLDLFRNQRDWLSLPHSERRAAPNKVKRLQQSCDKIKIQSAENCKGFSETVRQLPDNEEYKFWNWFAGIIDGDGNFDIRKVPLLCGSNKKVLKQIRIKLHNRDIKILTRIQDFLHMGAWWSGISPLCLKLSNSGDVLKLLVPSLYWKILSGWTNYSEMVTSQKMSENEMGYRGSKSEYQLPQPKDISVKEQRVDGSWLELVASLHDEYIKLSNLRYTLMYCESSYQVRVPSKQIYRRPFMIGFHTISTVSSSLLTNTPVIIHPLYFTGFVDGEGCFLIVIRQNNNSSTGWNVALKFQISLHIKDIALLEKFRDFLGGVGFISKEKADVIRYRIHSIKDLSILINHLDNYPLITQKLADFLIFKQVFSLILNKEHLTMEGLHKII